MAIRRSFFLLLTLLAVPASVLAQSGGRVSVEKYGFSLVCPNAAVRSEGISSVLEFTGSPASYGEKARYFISSIRKVSSSSEVLESYMASKSAAAIFERNVIASLQIAFPDARPLSKGSGTVGGRRTMFGTFAFTAGGLSMKGRYMIILVAEQSSIYTFNWSCEEKFFDLWDQASEALASSLKTDNLLPAGPHETD